MKSDNPRSIFLLEKLIRWPRNSPPFIDPALDSRDSCESVLGFVSCSINNLNFTFFVAVTDPQRTNTFVSLAFMVEINNANRWKEGHFVELRHPTNHRIPSCILRSQKKCKIAQPSFIRSNESARNCWLPGKHTSDIPLKRKVSITSVSRVVLLHQPLRW